MRNLSLVNWCLTEVHDTPPRNKDCLTRLEKRLVRPLSCRDHYNLACLHSVFGDRYVGPDRRSTAACCYQTALTHLRSALDPGGTLVEWAQRDPDLRGVRAHCSQSFAAIIADVRQRATLAGQATAAVPSPKGRRLLPVPAFLRGRL